LAYTYFLTGATGLVGSYIARRILAEGGRVCALKRSDSRTDKLKDVASQIDWVEGDIHDVLQLQQAIDRADFVIHAAALVSFNPSDRTRLFKTNIEGTANVVNLCLESGKRLCHISSVAALGGAYGVKAIDEKARWEEHGQHTQYGISKHLAEREVWRGVAEGLDAVIVNPSVVLAGNADSSAGQLLHYIYKGARFYPEGIVNVVDARDVAEAVYHLVHSPASGERYILNAASLSYRQFFAELAHRFQRKAPAIALGKSIVKPFHFFFTLAGWLGIKPANLSAEALRAAMQPTVMQGDKIVNQLQAVFQYSPLQETFSRICEEFASAAKA
jgi:nucleoside-diphosphate-sugar epimerase